MHLSCRNALLYVKAAYYMYIMAHSIEYTFYNPTSQDGNLKYFVTLFDGSFVLVEY